MEEFLNKPIKEIIKNYPKIGEILQSYEIACVSCNAGSCLLKDIVEIHNLSREKERELLSKIAKVIYPDKEVEIPTISRKSILKEKAKPSPPIKKLMEEHNLIKRWLSLIPKILEDFDLRSEEYKRIILEGVDFIRSYADRFHHAKEEEVLFGYFDKNLEIIKTMLSEHDTARTHVRAILEAIEKNDKTKVIEHLNSYKELLSEHIKKEDEILYPWMERNLNITQIGKLFAEFLNKDVQMGENLVLKYENFIEDLEKRFNKITEKWEVKK